MRQQLRRQDAGDAGHVVVADERQRHERLEELRVPSEVPIELEQVAVRQSAPDGLPQLVLGDRVDPAGLNERGVVAVDDLADDVGIRVPLAHARQHLRPEGLGHGVGRVEPPAVGAGVEPVVHDRDDVIDDRGSVVVERDQLAVPLERHVVRLRTRTGPVGPCEPEPVRLRHRRALRQYPRERRETPPDVVEHTVEQHPQASRVGCLDQPGEGVDVTEPRIDAQVVDGVVAVGVGGEHRAEREPGDAELDGVVQPVDDPVQPVAHRPPGITQRFGPGKTQGIDLPPDHVLHPPRTGTPHHHLRSSSLAATTPRMPHTDPARNTPTMISWCAPG